MADFGGFEIKTPEEVLAGMAQQRQAITMLPPAQQAAANVQFQIANLFGNPELKKARDLETKIQGVHNKIPPSGDLNREKARLTEMFDAVKDLDPLAAAQISQQMAAVDSELFERKRLTAADARAERNTAINEQNADINLRRFNGSFWDTSDLGYLIDPQNPEAEPEFYDLTDPAQAQAYEQRRSQGMSPLSYDDAVKMMGADGARGELKKLINNSTFEKKGQGYSAQIQYLDKATKLISRLKRNPETGLLTMDVKRGVVGLAAEAKALIRSGGWTDEDGNRLDEAATQSAISRKVDDMIENDELQIAQQDRALFKAAVLNMGYVLARSLDSGGRLSDQDVNMAIQMLTGGSPIFEDGTISIPMEQMVAVLYDRGQDIKTLMEPDQVDGIFIEERAKYGDEQALLLKGYRESASNKFTLMDELVKNTLPEHLYNRARYTYDPEALTDEEVRRMEEAEMREEAISAFQDRQETYPIFRPDAETEQRLAKNQGLLYNEKGEVMELIEDPTQLAKLLREGVKKGWRIRIRTAKGMENLSAPERGE